MTRHSEVPELVEQYMEAKGRSARWVTVREIRNHFDLDDSIAPAVSGFLHKIYQGPFFSFRYKVARIEKFQDAVPPYRIISRYFVEERKSPGRPMQENAKRSEPKKIQ